LIDLKIKKDKFGDEESIAGLFERVLLIEAPEEAFPCKRVVVLVKPDVNALC
jgi:hypothetical protein